jgi:hypothetical protein
MADALVIPLVRRDGSTPSVQPVLDVNLEPKGREPIILPPHEAQLIASQIRNLIHLASGSGHPSVVSARESIIASGWAAIGTLMGEDQ